MDDQTFELIKKQSSKILISREQRDEELKEKHREIINGILPEDW